MLLTGGQKICLSVLHVVSILRPQNPFSRLWFSRQFLRLYSIFGYCPDSPESTNSSDPSKVFNIWAAEHVPTQSCAGLTPNSTYRDSLYASSSTARFNSLMSFLSIKSNISFRKLHCSALIWLSSAFAASRSAFAASHSAFAASSSAVFAFSSSKIFFYGLGHCFSAFTSYIFL